MFSMALTSLGKRAAAAATCMGFGLAFAGPIEGASMLRHEIDMAKLPLAADMVAPAGATGLAGVNYRLWVARGSAEWGVGVGAIGFVPFSIDPEAAYSREMPAMHLGDDPRYVPTLMRVRPMVTVGMRLHLSRASALFADASDARGLGDDPHADYVHANVGMEWKPAPHRLGFDHGAIGIRFDSGYRLSLKPRSGGLALYLRGRF